MSWQGIRTQLGEVYDAYADPIKDRLEPKPFSVEELKEKLKNKEIGTEWYNQEIRKLNALKDLVPEKRQEQIASGRAAYGDNWVMWEDKIYIRKEENGVPVIDGPNGRWPEGHPNHPWEAEAIEAETE